LLREGDETFPEASLKEYYFRIRKLRLVKVL
jgi:hypothetical protein